MVDDGWPDPLAEVDDLLGRLDDVLDELARKCPDYLGSGDTAQHLLRAQSRVQALAATSARRFRASSEWQEDGAKSPAAWLAAKTHLPKAACSRAVRLGRFTWEGPIGRAWGNGEISDAHVAALASARTRRSERAWWADLAQLVEYAKTLRFDDFTKVLAYWEQAVDPDGADDEDERRRNQRDAYLVESIGGMFLGKMTLDPISGAIVAGELARLERELFEADWAKAKADLDREPKLDELPRTSAQRRADALVEMATRSASTPPGSRRPAPLFSVLVGYETLHGRICQLASGSGSVVAPSALLPWLDEAYIERAVFSLRPRVEVSENARLFTGATRRGVELRDLRCTHPLCDVPLERCEVDHVIPYAVGGSTTQENGRLLCGFHNRLRHKRPPPGGQTRPPDGRPQQSPRRT